MKKILFTLTMLGAAGLLVSAVAQDMPADTNPPPPPPDMPTPEAGGPPPPTEAMQVETSTVETPAPAATVSAETNGVTATEEMATETTAETVTTNLGPIVIEAATAKAKPAEEIQTEFAPPAKPVGTNNPDGIVMNFKNAPLEMVLNYLSDAAGFIIVLDTRVNGNVSVISSHPMTRDEAVDLLNSVLNKNGYAAIRSGRTLTIVDKNDAKTRNIPVKTGNEPEQIPNNAEIVTQIIPIRFVEARQLVSDLTSFVSPQATVVANEAGNAIVITDTQQNIRHLTEIIRAIDNSAQSEMEIRVFRLKHANPTEIASQLSSVFPSSGSGGSTQSPINFRGGGGGPGGFFQRMMGGGGGQQSGGSSADRVRKATAVTAVADARIQAVIVTAPKDLMDQIASMMKELDVPSTRDQQVYVFKMNNADPQQAAQVLQNMFQTSGSTRGSGSSSSQNSALMQRSRNNATTSGQSGTSSTSFGSRTTGGRTGGSQF
jgi:type II secretory pathway component GspD/PulD (secretin)